MTGRVNTDERRRCEERARAYEATAWLYGLAGDAFQERHYGVLARAQRNRIVLLERERAGRAPVKMILTLRPLVGGTRRAGVAKESVLMHVPAPRRTS